MQTTCMRRARAPSPVGCAFLAALASHLGGPRPDATGLPPGDSRPRRCSARQLQQTSRSAAFSYALGQCPAAAAKIFSRHWHLPAAGLPPGLAPSSAVQCVWAKRHTIRLLGPRALRCMRLRPAPGSGPQWLPRAQPRALHAAGPWLPQHKGGSRAWSWPKRTSHTSGSEPKRWEPPH